MPKRKLTDYFAQSKSGMPRNASKRFKPFGGFKSGGGTRAAMLRARRISNSYRPKLKYRGKRRSRAIPKLPYRGLRPKVMSNLPVAKYNVQTWRIDVADTFTVPQSASAVGGSDSGGKRCCYALAGATGGGANSQPLMSLEHLGQIVEILYAQQPTTSASTETRCHIMDCTATTEFVNMSTSDAKVTQYLCSFRRDIPLNSNSNFTNIFNILGEGFAQRSNPLAGNYFGNALGMVQADLTPYDSHRFTSCVKIITGKQFIMRPGDTRVAKIKKGFECITWNRYYTQSAPNQSPTAGNRDVARRKGEMFYLWKIEGTPCNGAANKAQLSYTTPKLDFITKYHYNFAMVNNSSANMYFGNAVNFTVLANNDQSIVNDDQGLPGTTTNA